MCPTRALGGGILRAPRPERPSKVTPKMSPEKLIIPQCLPWWPHGSLTVEVQTGSSRSWNGKESKPSPKLLFPMHPKAGCPRRKASSQSGRVR